MSALPPPGLQAKYVEQAGNGPARLTHYQGAAAGSGLAFRPHQDVDAANVDEGQVGEVYHQIDLALWFLPDRARHRARDGGSEVIRRRHVHLSPHLDDGPRRAIVGILPFHDNAKCLEYRDAGHYPALRDNQRISRLTAQAEVVSIIEERTDVHHRGR